MLVLYLPFEVFEKLLGDCILIGSEDIFLPEFAQNRLGDYEIGCGRIQIRDADVELEGPDEPSEEGRDEILLGIFYTGGQVVNHILVPLIILTEYAIRAIDISFSYY